MFRPIHESDEDSEEFLEDEWNKIVNVECNVVDFFDLIELEDETDKIWNDRSMMEIVWFHRN